METIRKKTGKGVVMPEKKQQAEFMSKIIRLCTCGFVTGSVLFGISMANFRANGQIIVEADSYHMISEEHDRRADAAAALSTAEKASEQSLKIEIPDYCPVNYAAYAPIAMVYDKTTGEVLYSKNETEKCSPASLTKLMTACVALDLAADDFNYVAGEELDLIQEGASLAKIKKCYTMNTAQLMDGMIMKGGSDAAYTAAANIGRLLCDNEDVSSLESVSKFVEIMNTSAISIGCDNTHFTNPDGYYDENCYTTGLDMLKLAVYASDHKEIMTAAGKEHSGGKLVSGQTYEWVNSNKMIIEANKDYYEYATGLKTGMTRDSGYCIAATAERYGHELVCIVMNADTAEHRTFDVTSLFEISFGYLKDISNAATEAG